MLKRRLIGIAGPTASGKSTIAKGLIDHLKADTHRFSSILASIADGVQYPKDKASLQQLSTTLRAVLGEDVLARGMCEWVAKSHNDTIVVEGIRRQTDINLLASVAKKTERAWVLLYIDAPQDTRLARINTRLTHEHKNTLTHEEFMILDNQECENELPLLKEQAGHIYHNIATSSEVAIQNILTFID